MNYKISIDENCLIKYEFKNWYSIPLVKFSYLNSNIYFIVKINKKTKKCMLNSTLEYDTIKYHWLNKRNIIKCDNDDYRSIIKELEKKIDFTWSYYVKKENNNKVINLIKKTILKNKIENFNG